MIKKLVNRRFPSIKYISHAYTKEMLVLHLESTKKIDFCPYCKCGSDRIHSYHIRKFIDLPYNKYEMVIYLKYSKFFCVNDGCKYTTFCEQFDFIGSSEKKTHRLIQKIIDAYEECSAQNAVDILKKNGIKVSKATVCNLKNKFV